jgi:diaminopimelate decarboxylase
MKYFDSKFFHYQNSELYCESVPVKKLIDIYGTPVFIYSKNFFRERFLEFDKAFEKVHHKIFFASKSNFNLNVIKIFSDLGAGIDVNSSGELYRALQSGVNPKNILLTGVGKTKDEIILGLENDVLLIKAESIQEVKLISKLASKLGKKADVALRVNPDVDPKTHPYISTGLAENKFGIDSASAIEIFKECSNLPNVNMCGIDMHIGSQITTVEPFVEAVIKMSELTKKIISAGIKIKHFDIGGGMGVIYNDEKPFSPQELADALVPIFMSLDCDIFFEPGRFLTANGGILATEVLYTKQNKSKNFIVVDAAMTDLLRPSIYKAYHHIQPVQLKNHADIKADIVGPVCESGDFFAKDREIENVESGEFLALMSAGAYGMVMSSNYNARRRAPEIIVDNTDFFVTRSRESFDHLLFDEKIIPQLHK